MQVLHSPLEQNHCVRLPYTLKPIEEAHAGESKRVVTSAREESEGERGRERERERQRERETWGVGRKEEEEEVVEVAVILIMEE